MTEGLQPSAGALAPDGDIAAWRPLGGAALPGLAHRNYGGNGLACDGDRLLIVDAERTFVVRRAADGSAADVRVVAHPHPFAQRTLFIADQQPRLTVAPDGRAYHLTGW